MNLIGLTFSQIIRILRAYYRNGRILSIGKGGNVVGGRPDIAFGINSYFIFLMMQIKYGGSECEERNCSGLYIIP